MLTDEEKILAANKKFDEKSFEKIATSTNINRYNITPISESTAILAVGGVATINVDPDNFISIADLVGSFAVSIEMLQRMADTINLLFPRSAIH